MTSHQQAILLNIVIRECKRQGMSDENILNLFSKKIIKSAIKIVDQAIDQARKV